MVASSSQPDHDFIAVNHVNSMDVKPIDTNHANSMGEKPTDPNHVNSEDEKPTDTNHANSMDEKLIDADHVNSMDSQDEVESSKKSYVEFLKAGSTNLVENDSSHADECSNSENPDASLVSIANLLVAMSAMERNQHVVGHDKQKINLHDPPSYKRGRESPSTFMTPQMNLLGNRVETENCSKKTSPCTFRHGVGTYNAKGQRSMTSPIEARQLKFDGGCSN